MALFFRGETRKFFLILLERRRSEKNCAGFGRELREFSRGMADGCSGRVGVGRRVASKRPGCAGGGPRVRRRALAGRAARARAAERARPHPSNAQRSDWLRVRDVHNGGAASRAGQRAHHSLAQGFESRRRPDVHTSIGPRFERMATLTVEIHSAASRCRREISTPSDACPDDAAFALTFRMHRFASRFGGTISTPPSALATIRSDGATRDSARLSMDGPASACARTALALIGAHRRLSARAVASPDEMPARVWISPPPGTKNPLNFDGEHRHAIEQGCRFGCE